MSAVANLPHRKFSVNEYHNFIEQGVFRPGERIELWEGEFIEMSPIGMRHAACVNFLVEALRDLLGKSVVISPQNPIVLDDLSEPQPDICMLERREDFYRRSDATAKNVLLAMEVADTTVKYDRDKKLPLYAEAEIPEVWIVNLPNEIIEVHTQPSVGLYQFVKIYKRGEIVKSEALPELNLPVNKILG